MRVERVRPPKEAKQSGVQIVPEFHIFETDSVFESLEGLLATSRACPLDSLMKMRSGESAAIARYCPHFHVEARETSPNLNRSSCQS